MFFDADQKNTLREDEDVYCLLYWSGMRWDVFSRNTFFYIHTVLVFIDFCLTCKIDSGKAILNHSCLNKTIIFISVKVKVLLDIHRIQTNSVGRLSSKYYISDQTQKLWRQHPCHARPSIWCLLLPGSSGSK